jgi:uncharacterized protein (DUF736 family)
MQQIGEFKRQKTGYRGRIHTLSLNLDVAIVATEASDTENAPDYRVYSGNEDGPEIGAGWKRSSEKAGDFVSIQLDDPILVQPIRASLFRSGDDEMSWSLHWSRPRERGEKE